MSDTVTETNCKTCESSLHTRINERPTWKLVAFLFLIFFTLLTGSYGYTTISMSKVEENQEKIEAKQWDAAEKMVTKNDLREFKQENNARLDKIQLSIEKIRR